MGLVLVKPHLGLHVWRCGGVSSIIEVLSCEDRDMQEAGGAAARVLQ